MISEVVEVEGKEGACGGSLNTWYEVTLKLQCCMHSVGDRKHILSVLDVSWLDVPAAAAERIVKFE